MVGTFRAATNAMIFIATIDQRSSYSRWRQVMSADTPISMLTSIIRLATLQGWPIKQRLLLAARVLIFHVQEACCVYSKIVTRMKCIVDLYVSCGKIVCNIYLSRELYCLCNILSSVQFICNTTVIDLEITFIKNLQLWLTAYLISDYILADIITHTCNTSYKHRSTVDKNISTVLYHTMPIICYNLHTTCIYQIPCLVF